VISDTTTNIQLPTGVLNDLNAATTHVVNNGGLGLGLGVISDTSAGIIQQPTATEVLGNLVNSTVRSVQNILPNLLDTTGRPRYDIIPIKFSNTRVAYNDNTYDDLLHKVNKTVCVEEQCAHITRFIKNTTVENYNFTRESLDSLIVSSYSRVFYKTICDIKGLYMDAGWNFEKKKALEKLLIKVKNDFIQTKCFSNKTLSVDTSTEEYTTLKMHEYHEFLKNSMMRDNKELFTDLYEEDKINNVKYHTIKRYNPDIVELKKPYVINSDSPDNFKIDNMDAYFANTVSKQYDLLSMQDVSKVLYFSSALQNVNMRKEELTAKKNGGGGLSEYEMNEFEFLLREKKQLKVCLDNIPVEELKKPFEFLNVNSPSIDFSNTETLLELLSSLQ